MNTSTSSAAVRGVTATGMAYERRGQGRPIVLIHGWCLSRKMWMYAEEALLSGHQIVTPDLAGFGMSDGLGGPYSLTRYADDIAGLLAELHLQDAVLVGFAFGAAVALELASRHDKRVAAVVSVGAPNASSSPYEKMPKSMRRDWPDFARRSANALFHNEQSEANLAWLERMFSSTALPVALETVAILAAYDPVSTAEQVKVAQLFIHADQDQVAPISVGKACVERALNARMEVVADCGHLIVLDQKTRFHEIVRSFVASI
jgi:pimeloyl-ACP methyl ester carboxylesterase